MKLQLRNVGQLKDATVQFGDLTVLVGPQAGGKSIFLQFLKLVLDGPVIAAELRRSGYDWERKFPQFLELYLGEGMGSVWHGTDSDAPSQVLQDDRPVDLLRHLKGPPGRRRERLFFIPAQRVITLSEGWPRQFHQYRPGDPYVVRAFSQQLVFLMQSGLGKGDSIFPQEGRMKREAREAIAERVFGGFALKLGTMGVSRRLVLQGQGEAPGLPFMVWSAGQREFVPLLLGLYWLLPPTKTPTRQGIQWVVIEEMEACLHPGAISAVMLVALDLLKRGYRVALSTHSPHVLDIVWGIRTLQRCKANPSRLLDMFEVKHSQQMVTMATKVLDRNLRVYYCSRQPDAEGRNFHDISSLDPGSDDPQVAGWGGLTEFSGRIGDIVADVVAQSAGEAGG